MPLRRRCRRRARWPAARARVATAATAATAANARAQGRWREFFSLKKATGKPVVVAFTAGDAALYRPGLTDSTLVSQALAALRGLFGASIPASPEASWVTRWHEDPYSLGSYSVMPPGTRGGERAALAAPVSRMLYFAGEAAHKDFPATVQGAWLTGEAAAAAALRDNPVRG